MIWEVKTSPTCGIEVSKHNSRGGFNLPKKYGTCGFDKPLGYRS